MDTQRVTDAVGVLPRHAARGGSSGGSDGGHVSWAVVGRVGRLFLPYWVSLMAVFGVLAANAYFDSLMPQLYRSFVDEAVPKQDVERIVSLAFQVVGVLCAAVVMKVGKEALTTHVAEHMARSLRESLFSHLQGLPLQHFVQNRSAEFAALFNQELTGATGGVCRLIFSTAQNLFTLAFLLRAMYGMDWRLTVGCVVLVPAFYVPSLYMSSRMRAYKQEALQRRSGMNEALAESLTMAGVILARTFGQQRFFLDRFTRESEALSRTTSRANLLHTSFFQVLLVAMSFMSIIVYMLGALIFILFSTDLSSIQGKIKGTYGQVVGLGGITMGTVVAFSSYIGRLYGPLSDLSGVQVQLATCAVSFERIFHYVDLPAAAPAPAGSSSSRWRWASGTSSSRLRKEQEQEQEVPLLRLGDVVGDVRFERVSFSYASPPPLPLGSTLPEGGGDAPPEEETAAGGEEGTRAPPDGGGKAEERPKATRTPRPEAEAEEEAEEARRWTLADVSVHFRAGEVTAIVGANGSGKTTLAFLLMGFLRPQRGEIFIDGHPLSRIAGSHHHHDHHHRSSSCFPSRAPAPGPQGLAAHVGFLSQECYLLNDTVATNLRLGRADATTDELHEICRVVGVHDKICSLPDGYDTVVGHRASSLSGGEKQKLAIARVLLRRPKLLVLDEFDSSLDPHSQRRIHDYINRQFAANTRIVIAHRPEAVRNADRVVVLHRGRVVECGTPAALLAKNGHFASFFSTAGSSSSVQA